MIEEDRHTLLLRDFILSPEAMIKQDQSRRLTSCFLSQFIYHVLCTSLLYLFYYLIYCSTCYICPQVNYPVLLKFNSQISPGRRFQNLFCFNINRIISGKASLLYIYRYTYIYIHTYTANIFYYCILVLLLNHFICNYLMG